MKSTAKNAIMPPSRFLFERFSMSAQIIDGKEVARQRLSMLADRVAERKNKGLHTPCLAVILVGDDPASAVYVRNKKIACEKAGFESRSYEMPSETTQDELLALVDELNGNRDVDGILVQLPLPKQINCMERRSQKGEVNRGTSERQTHGEVEGEVAREIGVENGVV